MNSYFVRHGQSESNKSHTVTGWIDSPLTNQGVKETRRITNSIPLDISTIYSSDLIRCKQTTHLLNKHLSAPIIYDSRLRERNFGSLQGKTWEQIQEETGLDLKTVDTNQRYDYRHFGGESSEDVKNRIIGFVDDIEIAEKGKNVLVITHGGVIRILYYILKDQIHERIQNASIHEFEFLSSYQAPS